MKASRSPPRSSSCPSSSFQTASRSEPADTVFLNGNIYTVNDAATAGRSDRDQRRPHSSSSARTTTRRNIPVPPRARSISRAKTVVPGTDRLALSHFGVGERLAQLNLEKRPQPRSVPRQGQRSRPRRPTLARWITGRGWIETFWKPPVFPTREELDKVAPANPVFLERADGHGAVANSKALQLAGIDAKTPNPFRGRNLARQKNRRAHRHVARQRDGVGREENPAADRRRKTRRAFCSACNARSLSAGARFKTPGAISPSWS